MKGLIYSIGISQPLDTDYPFECMLSRMEMDSTAIQATISADMLEIYITINNFKNRKEMQQPPNFSMCCNSY
jgi:hypothetical protein